ncbi:MAG: hypothetical protein ACFFA0_10630 [Promethearchaeota archaeon]
MIKKLKRRLCLFSFLLIFFLSPGIVLNVGAIKYKTGVKGNDELIWKCKVCDEDELNLIFGTGWDNSGIFQNLSKGKMMKWVINSVDLNDTIIKIEFSVWFWTDNTTWGIKDNDSQIIFLTDPSSYAEEVNFSEYTSFTPFWFPIPVGEYMGGLNLNEWYDVDNRVLPTLNVDIPKDGIFSGYPNKSIKIIAIYNDQGILNSYKLYTKGNVVIIDIALDFLPFYVIPTLIILFTTLSLGVIIYIIWKYKSNRPLSSNLK